MADKLKAGDKVEWKSSQGAINGTVEQKVTKPAQVKGHTAKASPDAPQYKVRSDKTGAEAIHKPDSLKKR
jgi:Hypervirulence associated proteins TUDOR domain